MSTADSISNLRPWQSSAERRSPLLLYGIPLLAVALALCMSVWLRPVFSRNPFLFYYAAVMFSAWYGGLRSGLIATPVAALVADYVWARLLHPFPNADDFAQIALFMSVGIFTSVLSETLHKAERRVQFRLRQQVAAAELGHRALAEELDAFMDHAARALAEALNVEYCKILELLPDHSAFVLRAGVGWKPGVVGQARVSAGKESQAGYTLQASAPVIVQDVRTEKRFSAPPLLVEHQVVSGLSVVIPGPSGPYGVLGVHSGTAHAFTADDVHLLETVANLLAISIQRSRNIQRLAEGEARFRTLAELIPQMAWSTTADGAVDYISQSWCDFTGLTMAESLGYGGWQRVLHPDEAARVRRCWEESLATGKTYEVECRLRRVDGMYRWILARAVPMRSEDGRIAKWFGTCTDIHEQKLAEEALRRAEKLAAAGRLAATVAHEINNPLACITNLVYLARQQVESLDSPCAEYLTQADRELHRVTHMVRQTLAFYKDTTTPSLVDPQHILNDLVSVYAQKIAAKQIRIEERYETSPKMLLHVGELHRVVANLLLNAIDASPMQGTIRLHLRACCNWKDPRRAGIRISVADLGGGIQPEDRARLFEPFFTTKKDVGTGLGLWAVRGILLKHGGTVRFRSSTRPGRSGTVFGIFFPVAQAHQSTHSSAANTQAA